MTTQSIEERVSEVLYERRAAGRRISTVAVAEDRRSVQRRAVPGWPGLLAELAYVGRNAR